MSRRNPFPMDPEYWGAEQVPFVPVFVEDPLSPDASREPTEPTPSVPGDADTPEKSKP